MCEECELTFKEHTQAQHCEEWCSKHTSCNLEITKQAIERIKG
jgi:hypothetical protein